ncbi:MAG: hypothetical protein KAJ10_03645 [Thermodesulfovibrionia bacterium]|nr:hypothetical protein [Thermodesulfovibrionia bacterium]
METQIFYWTGVVIWWGVCLAVMVSIVACVIITPVVAYHRCKKYFWQWKWAAIIAEHGFTQDDVRFATTGTAKLPDHCTMQEMLAWVETVKMRGSYVRKM